VRSREDTWCTETGREEGHIAAVSGGGDAPARVGASAAPELDDVGEGLRDALHATEGNPSMVRSNSKP